MNKAHEKFMAVFLAVSLIGALSWADASVSASGSQSADLMRCYEWALRQSESLQMQSEQIEQLEQQYRQILGSVLPNITFQATQKYQQANPSGSGLSPTSNPLVYFSAAQPLFSGFREFMAIKSFKHQGAAARAQLKFAREALFQDIFNAFYMVVNLEQSAKDTESLKTMMASRVRELKDRERLGKSRVSEVLSVESQLASIEAQLEAIRGQVLAARELLSFLTGQDLSNVVLEDPLTEVLPQQSQEELLRKAQSRSDVTSAREMAEAYRKQVDVAWGNWYPTIGLVGDYYLKRIPFYEPIHWDASINLSFPVFSGGSTLAQVSFAKSQWRASEDNARFVLRQAVSQIRTQYIALQSASAQWRTLREAYEKARESYRLETREYRLGIVDNLTVLQSMNTMQSAQLNMDQTSVAIKIAYLKLKVATEELPGDAFSEVKP